MAVAEEEWRDHMVLEPAELKALLDYLDEQLPAKGCDHTLRLTLAWASDHAVQPDQLRTSLAYFGGTCDCEVLANVDPETQIYGWPSYVALFGSG